MKKLFVTLSLLSLGLSQSVFATRLAQFGYLRYNDEAFTDKSLDRNKSFTKIDVPIELHKTEKNSAYALLGGQYNFIKSNPFVNDDSFYLGAASTFKVDKDDKLGYLAAYYYHSASDLSNLAHDLYLGVETDYDMPLGFKMKRAVLWLRYVAKNIQTPSPALQFERKVGDNWSLKTSLLIDFKFKMYSPILPTKIEATYQEDKDLRAGFGYNFDETIQARPKQGHAYYQTGSRGLMYGFADYRMIGDFWTGIQTGMGYEMISNFDENGDALNDSANRFIPFFVNINFSHIV